MESGRSINGAWSKKQLKALNVPMGKSFKLKKGWYKRLIGSDVPEDNVKLFFKLKDAHLRNKETGKIKEKYIKKGILKQKNFAPKSKKREPKPLVDFWIAVQTCGFIRELLECNQGLNQWEIDFIDHLQYHERFSIKQAALIEKLRHKVFNIGFLTELPLTK